jgi:hypothetical protein
VEEGTSGTPTPAGPPAPQQPKPFGQQVRAFLARAQAEPSGLFAAVIVVVVSAVASLIGWIPLGLPSQWVSGVLPSFRCTGNTPGTLPMYGCSAVVGFLAIAGSLVIVLALFVLRRPIAKAVAALAARTPEEARFLIAPVAGTLAFTIAWGGAHHATGGLTGLVPQTVFPAVVGLFLYATARWGDGIRRVAGPLLALRDRYPIGYRIVAALLIPLVVSLIITNEQRVSQTALKEQVVAIVALLTGYLALVPRTGPPLAGIEGTLRELGAP